MLTLIFLYLQHENGTFPDKCSYLKSCLLIPLYKPWKFLIGISKHSLYSIKIIKFRQFYVNFKVQNNSVPVSFKDSAVVIENQGQTLFEQRKCITTAIFIESSFFDLRSLRREVNLYGLEIWCFLLGHFLWLTEMDSFGAENSVCQRTCLLTRVVL